MNGQHHHFYRELSQLNFIGPPFLYETFPFTPCLCEYQTLQTVTAQELLVKVLFAETNETSE